MVSVVVYRARSGFLLSCTWNLWVGREADGQEATFQSCLNILKLGAIWDAEKVRKFG